MTTITKLPPTCRGELWKSIIIRRSYGKHYNIDVTASRPKFCHQPQPSGLKLAVPVVVICSQKWTPRAGSKVHYLVQNPGNEYPVLHHNHIKHHTFLVCFCNCCSVSDSTVYHFSVYKVLCLISSTTAARCTPLCSLLSKCKLFWCQ